MVLSLFRPALTDDDAVVEAVIVNDDDTPNTPPW